MSYIGRFFRWAIKSLWKFGKDLAMFAVRQAISFIRFSFPYILRVFFAGMAITVQLAVLGFLALVRPVPNVARKLAEEWSDKAVRDGFFPSLHQLRLTAVLLVAAYLALTLGFLVDLFTVVFTSVWVYQLIIYYLK